MTNKLKTQYRIQNNELLKNNQPTGIQIKDDYLYIKGNLLDIYIEDGVIFRSKKIFPFLKWPKISSPTDLHIDQRESFGAQLALVF